MTLLLPLLSRLAHRGVGIAVLAFGFGSADSVCAAQAREPRGTPPAEQARISPEALMRHVNVLAADSMEGRLFGSPGSAKARRYLTKAFTDAGLLPVGTTLELPFESVNARDSSVRRGVNVVGQIRGRTNPERVIAVTAHYDHLGTRNGQIYNGADDDASGTAALIELARWFRANPPANTLIFAAFDGEESGLLGSRAFVAAPPMPITQVVMNVSLDMVGRNDKNELYASGTSHYPFLKPLIDSVITRSSITLKYGHDDPNGPRGDDWTTQSDHGSFHRAKIPFIYFGVEDHPDYHRPTDDPERLMPTFYGGAITSVLDAIRIFDRNLSTIAAAKTK